jgi:aminoglycoside phosphotransferase (APT) family kinase protein
VHEWSAEVSVDRALARRLIGGQFEALARADLRLLAEGWDSVVWLVDERWVFLFPRREIVVAAVEREIAVLPRLAPLLPLPIPVPVFAGRPAEGYPWPFFGAALIPGRELAQARCSDAARARLARPLAEFLRALHGPGVARVVGALDDAPAAGELPVDPFGRADMGLRVPRTRERLAELERGGRWRAPAGVHDVLEAAAALPPPEPTAVVHGDLHLRHLLVDAHCRAAGVIDWVDLCRADPAVDLPLYWSLLPPRARPDFLAAYGPVTEDQLLRSRVLALFLGATLAVYARHERLTDLEREALAGLARAAAD